MGTSTTTTTKTLRGAAALMREDKDTRWRPVADGLDDVAEASETGWGEVGFSRALDIAHAYLGGAAERTAKP